MCGIIGYIGKKEGAFDKIYSGLKDLEYRGYDSCGVALSIGEGEIEVFRTLASPEKLAPRIKDENFDRGLGHTRWATHGKVTIENAHPQTSFCGNVCIVHNGVIENAEEIKKSLLAKKYKFSSDTDTEVLVNLIAHFYKKINKKNDGDGGRLKAIKSALNSVEGTYGLGIMFKDSPDKIYGARRSSPLIVGVGKGENFLASDANALPPYIKKVIYLEDEQIVSITKEDFSIHWLKSGLDIDGLTKIKRIKARKQRTNLGEHSCYMEKEIFEQPNAIRETLRGRFCDDYSCIKLGGIDLDKKISRILFLGCGTAYHAGLLGKYYMQNIAGVPASVEYSSEFKYKNNPTEDDTLVVGISQSGETLDTLAAIQEAKSRGFNTMAITNVVSSSIAREVPEGIYQRVGPEISVASTKAFSSQVTILLMLAVALGRKRDMNALEAKRYINQIRRIPELMEQALLLNDAMSRLGNVYHKSTSLDFLGRQYMYPIALEGALKLKELTYCDSHAYPSGEIKHGPLALVWRGRRHLFLAPQETLKDKNISNIKEIMSRNGDVFLLKQKGQEFPEDDYREIIEIPKCKDFLLPIISVIPLQLLAMHMAKAKGHNVDKPRNLAKSVTVE
jgi:glucosamine--fructose-6-phosphate aminotransferase (isomerizing)